MDKMPPITDFTKVLDTDEQGAEYNLQQIIKNQEYPVKMPTKGHVLTAQGVHLERIWIIGTDANIGPLYRILRDSSLALTIEYYIDNYLYKAFTPEPSVEIIFDRQYKDIHVFQKIGTSYRYNWTPPRKHKG